ncbi:MAG: PAS domain-containing sensor histidine kinase [Alphaproteobacteria bacterium]|nr:PAS domain-containing sensor histidine kinase [Alphaproteobacteria bacterium]
MSQRFARWARSVDLGRRLAIALALLAVGSGVATYVALTRTGPLGPDPNSVLTLLLIDLVLLLALGVVVSRRLVLLWIERRRGLVGSRLHSRLVVLFGLLAVTPAIFVAVFSALFFNLGLQSWFNDRVSTALNASVEVATAYVEEHRKQIRADVLSLAAEINRGATQIRTRPGLLQQILEVEARARSLPEALVLDGAGNVLARAGLSFSMEFDLVRVADQVKGGAARGEVVIITTEDDQRVRALVRLDQLVGSYLYVGRLVDAGVILHADQTRNAVAEYQRLESERSGFQVRFALIFIVVALLLLLAAVWLALVFASRLIAPVSALVQASERIRAGDLSARVPEGPPDDEVGSLSRAFNRMTSQLENQRGELIDANQQLDNRRRFTEAVLSGVSSGVVGLDAEGRINLPNRTAVQLLETSAESLIGRSFVDVVPELNGLVGEARERPWRLAQGQVAIVRGGVTHTLLARVAAEGSAGTILGFVVTFDDVTELITAQRNAAWADIARRIAHEIKNPLTPIQLSAERLKRKYLNEIGSDPEVFKQCTETIIRQVGDIGRLIDEFSSFARMPTPVFREENLTELARQALFLPKVANASISFRVDAPDLPMLVHCDSHQVAQVLTNLLLNAVQAIAERPAAAGKALPPGQIVIRVAQEPDGVGLAVLDNGKGLPQGDRARLTEPYFTTREKGTGLGLAIVAKVMDDHGGRLSLDDRPGGGAVIGLHFPADPPLGSAEPAPVARLPLRSAV